MPRRKGPYGQYGTRGNSDLAKRRRIEAENLGMRLCRSCETLIPLAEVHPGSKTPYCKSCVRKRPRNSKKPKPQSEHPHMVLIRRNAALKSSGLFYCTTCHRELPLTIRSGNYSKCTPCNNARTGAWSKRKRERLGRKKNAERRAKASKEAEKFGRSLAHSVRLVFRELGVVECRRHGWQEVRRDGSRSRCGACFDIKKLKRDRKVARAFVEHVSIRELFRRSGGICYLCNKRVGRGDASVDHVVPLSKGGKHGYANCRLAHRLCNSVKRDMGPLLAMCEPKIRNA